MKKKKNALIWQISNIGRGQNPFNVPVQNASYLIGTMHIRDAQAFRFENLFQEKILACAVFATEFNLDEAKNETLLALNLPEGEYLSQKIPPKTFAKIDKTLRLLTGQSLWAFNYLKPIVVANMLMESVLQKDRLESLDETLWSFASKNAKILRGIETYAEQVGILNKMDFAEQLENLKNTAKNFPKIRKQMQHITERYAQADIQALYKAARRTARGNRRLLLFDRNRIMAKRIAELTEGTTACIAIGAGHLAGEKGVLKLLKDAGFTVKPVFE